MTSTEDRIALRLEDLAPWDDVDALRNSEHRIEESSLRELASYGFDGDRRTLVGLGPVQRASRSREAAEVPDSQRMPHSEPPGPFIADDDDADAEELANLLRRRKLGPWAFAVPGVLLVAAAAVGTVRGLSPAPTPAPKPDAAVGAPPAKAGLDVKVNGAVTHVLVDGEDRGASPLSLRGLEPGSHVVSIADPAYALYSQPVLLTANQVTTIEPVLTFVRGTLRLEAGDGAEDAEVEVIGADERRLLQHLPATLEVAAGEYRIRGTRKGYAPFESTAVLSAASPKVEMSVVLGRQSTTGIPVAATALLGRPPATASEPSAVPNSSFGVLNVTSSAPANVVLDGHPLGKAPRLVRVPPGVHTVVFVHPRLGRQSLSVNVSPGHTIDASADFRAAQ